MIFLYVAFLIPFSAMSIETKNDSLLFNESYHSEENNPSPYSSESDVDSSDRNVEGLINDESESSASQNDQDYPSIPSNTVRKKRLASEKWKENDKRKENLLEDDDYELLEENLGISVLNRRRKYRRVRVGSSGDEAENDIENELFPEDENPVAQNLQNNSLEMDLEIHSSSEGEDVDDFIVDDDGQPIRKHRYLNYLCLQ